MYLVIDTETSQLYNDLLPSGHVQQPWIVTVAAVLMDRDKRIIGRLEALAQPEDGRTIHAEAAEVHGITTSHARRFGFTNQMAMINQLRHMSKQASVIIGWSVEYDLKVICSAIQRLGYDPAQTFRRPSIEIHDVMKAAAPFIRVPTEHESQSWKWPSLDAGREHFLGKGVREGAHNAWEDVMDTMEIWKALEQIGCFESAIPRDE